MLTDSEAASAAGRALAGRRRRVKAHCAVCGKPIEGVKTRMYCSDGCNFKAWRERNPERHLEIQREYQRRRRKRLREARLSLEKP